MVFIYIYTGEYLEKPTRQTAACIEEAAVIARRHFESGWFKQAQIRDMEERLLVDMDCGGGYVDLTEFQ